MGLGERNPPSSNLARLKLSELVFILLYLVYFAPTPKKNTFLLHHWYVL